VRIAHREHEAGSGQTSARGMRCEVDECSTSVEIRTRGRAVQRQTEPDAFCYSTEPMTRRAAIANRPSIALARASRAVGHGAQQTISQPAPRKQGAARQSRMLDGCWITPLRARAMRIWR